MNRNRRLLVDNIKRDQSGRCLYCGTALRRDAHIDHIVAKACGGSNDLSNLCLACPRCNTYKSGYSLKRWRDMLQRWDSKKGRYVNWPKWEDVERDVAIDSLTGMINKDRPLMNEPLQRIQKSTIHNLMKGLSTKIKEA